MERKVFISFLGTGKYVDCNYVYKEKKVNNVKYIQDALVQMFCKDWNENDEIVILLTEDASKIHWDADDGLKQKLMNHEIKANIREVRIPDGRNEDEIWVIFRKIYDYLCDGDTIIYDITHSFRSLPMLGIVLLNYSKFLKNISIDGIYYGAFESLGRATDVEKMPLSNRNAPIFDLTPFDNLLDWSVAADNFVNYGNSEKLVKCIRDGSRILMDKNGRNEFSEMLNSLKKNLELFSNDIATVRGQEIFKSESVVSLQNTLERINAKDFKFKALNPILSKVEEKISCFQSHDVLNGLNAVQWCISHNMTQQGFTLLQESIITLISVKEIDIINKHSHIIIDEPYNDLKIREDISSALRYLESKKDKNEWKSNNKEFFNELIELDIIKKFSKIYNSLSDRRNDINHAGFTKPAPALSLKEKLKTSYEDVKQIVNDYLK